MKTSAKTATSILALSIATTLPGLASAQTAEPGASNTIVVTATKRDQALDEVPGSISAVSQEDLQDLNAQSLSDYITRVPGVVFNDYQPGVSEVVIRGVASTTYHEANQATTGYYLNQIPLVEATFPIAIPDVDAFDLQQVEVLRGPQGTLFGSSSLGGAVNYTINEADPSGFDAAAEGGIGSTRRGGEINYQAKAMVNVPIVQDRLALRLVALQRFDAGYLDNLGTGVNGSNDLRARGLRGSLVWTPTETTTISALSMYQDYALDDQTYVLFGFDPVAGFDTETPTFTRNTNVDEFQDTDFFLNSIRFDQELGFANLTAIGSHIEKSSSVFFDDSVFLGIDPRTGTAQVSGSNAESRTDYAELRLTSNGNGPFEWLVGANYTKLRTSSTDGSRIPGIGTYIDANPGEFGGQSSSVIAPDDFIRRTLSETRVQEIALFGEASYTFADVFTVTLGGRLFEYESTPRLQFLPNAALIPEFDYMPGTQRESDFIPKVSLSYRPSDSFMVYALYSEGFRIGGINVYAVAAGTPLNFESDSTRNFEIGTRFDLVPDTMSFDISAYHIEWDNIQARLFVPVTFDAYTTNGGGAEIDGIEISLNLEPTDYLSFASNVTYTDARLSELLPDSFAPGGGYAAGTTLPGSSDWMISNLLDFHFDDMDLRPRIGIAHRYLSESPVAFGSATEKGDYHIVDLNASIALTEQLELSVYAKNVFNQYGILNAPFSFAGSVTRPRTIGATLRFSLN